MLDDDVLVIYSVHVDIQDFIPCSNV